MQKITVEMRFRELRNGRWNEGKSAWSSDAKMITTDEVLTVVAEALGDTLRRCRDGDTLTVTIEAN